MSVSTQGIRLRHGRRWLRRCVELFSSMRLAISLLTVICIASAIGTVVKQQEPLANYINQFGPFWAQLFDTLGVYSLYSNSWFLLILAALVVSTTLCVVRNTPRIVAQWNSFKDNMRVQSLSSFAHHARAHLEQAPQAVAPCLARALRQMGWQVKRQARSGGIMLAAKAGRARKLGYIAAHSAVVLICLGGLLDGDAMLRWQMWFNGKTLYGGGGLIADVPAEHRLAPSNPSFRANLLVSEGARASTAVLNGPSGVVLQDLPFAIELKKFVVEYYSTGAPKLFASDIIIHDAQTGAASAARVEVNHPVSYRGVQIYQSSFEDGGSRVKLKAEPLTAAAAGFEVQGKIGDSSQLPGYPEFTLEYTGLRTINVENLASFSPEPSSAGWDAALKKHLGAANKTRSNSALRNVGPSVSYKLRDAAGQAHEFNNYMLPVQLGADAVPTYLWGVRSAGDESFRYLRIPADEQGGSQGFLRLRAALAAPAVRAQAVARYVHAALPANQAVLVAQLSTSASSLVNLFATGGLQAIAQFLETNVQAEQRSEASQVLVRLLNGVLLELVQITRAQHALLPLARTPATQNWMTQAALSLSDALHYPAPLALTLVDFTPVQASVFQVTRTPGQGLVYGGCALLILGVFAMLYVRERRLWIWLTPHGSGSDLEMALSCNRQSLDVDREFERLRNELVLPNQPRK